MQRRSAIAIGVVAAVVLVGGVLALASDDGETDRVSADEGSTSTATTGAEGKGDLGELTTVPTTAPATTTTAAGATTTPGTSGGTAPAPAPTEPPPPTTAAPAPAVPLGQIGVRLTLVASLTQPIALVPRPGTGELWVAQQGGVVVALTGNGPVTMVDISAETEASGEQGLLGLAFDASGSRLYLSYTDNAGDSRVHEFPVAPGGAVDGASRRELLFVDQPYANHNGGNLVLGPDGDIWLGLGDGGSGGDPQGHAQRDGDPLGKMLRHAPGSAGFEIVAKGLRNPWRFSFDRTSGDLWIGDVGQGTYEEVDAVAFGNAFGANFGWNRREGTHPYNGGSLLPGDVDPVFEYTHSRGCSITGGFVYRGSRIPALVGTYVYGDFCEGVVRGLRVGTEEAPLGADVAQLSSFGQDLAGELYALSLAGSVFRLDPA